MAAFAAQCFLKYGKHSINMGLCEEFNPLPKVLNPFIIENKRSRI